MTYSSGLPQLGRVFVTDGGLETTLVFLEGLDLPCFAAFPLVLSDDGREILTRYYRPYLSLAQRYRTGIVLDAPTWRANLDRARSSASITGRSPQPIEARCASLPDSGPIMRAHTRP